jgi:restriction system protein
MRKNKPLKRKRRYRPKKVPTVEQVFSTLELSERALKKLFFDEELTEEEFGALFKSEYVSAPPEPLPDAKLIYSANKLQLIESNRIIFSSIEQEALAYFAKHPESLHQVSPRKFEELVASIFKNNGFRVELTPVTRDGGVDIIAVQKTDLLSDSLFLIECKRYAPENKVGIGVLQRMAGVVETKRANKGLIVTTSCFSADARQFADNHTYRLGLNEYQDIICWLNGLTGAKKI